MLSKKRPEAKKNDTGFIEITQDGIGRYSNTDSPEDIDGFYTSGIQTCTIILIKSQHAISLIHATSKLSGSSGINGVKKPLRM